MKVVVVYRDNNDYTREVTDYLRDFSQRTAKTIEEKDPDSTDGEAFCRAYDIVQYPTIIALSDDGRVHNMWSGTPLPTIDEVAYYAQ